VLFPTSSLRASSQVLRPLPAAAVLRLSARLSISRVGPCAARVFAPGCAFGGTGADKITFYVRQSASTYGQTLDAELEQLRRAGCTKIYREKVTGAHNDRRELLPACSAVSPPGDAVTVTRIDRLARSTFDLFAIVKQIVDAKAQFRSLAEPWADTGKAPGA
jgi:hypothetical protein